MSTDSLYGEVQHVLSRYKEHLLSFSQTIRMAKPDTNVTTQADLISKLDLIFTIDKDLQMVFRKINEQQQYLSEKKDLMFKWQSFLEKQDNLIDSFFDEIVNLKNLIIEERRKLEALKHLETMSPSDLDMLVSSSERLTLTSRPPELWTPDLPLLLHRPPYPTEDIMRSSKLFQVMNIGLTPKPIIEDPSMEKTIDKTPGFHQRYPEEDDLHTLELDLNPDLL